MKKKKGQTGSIFLTLEFRMEKIGYSGNSESITFLRCPYLLGEDAVFGSFTEGVADAGATA